MAVSSPPAAVELLNVLRPTIAVALTFAPQGGGDRAAGHRCPGEDVATAVLKTSLRFLADEIVYELAAQDLTIDTSRLPALPADRFVMASVSVGDDARWPVSAALAR